MRGQLQDAINATTLARYQPPRVHALPSFLGASRASASTHRIMILPKPASQWRVAVSDEEEWFQVEIPLEDRDTQAKPPDQRVFCWPDVAPTLTASSRGFVVLQVATESSEDVQSDDLGLSG